MTTATEILDTVIKLAKKHPDTEAECQYFNDDKTPCCIVGHAFYEHGITADTLAEIAETKYCDYDDLNRWTGINAGILGYVGIEDEETDAVTALARIQKAQDCGYRWGDAVKDGLAGS